MILLGMLGLALPLTACHETAQKLELWRIGMVERDWERIREPHQQPVQQPNAAQLIQEARAKKERAQKPLRFASDLHALDVYEETGVAKPSAEAPSDGETQSGTMYSSPL